MMNLRLFASTGGFCEDMPQLGDLEWLLRALRGGMSVVYVPRALILYREHAGNVSSVSFNTNRDFREALLICDRHGNDEALWLDVATYARTAMKKALRRVVTSLLRGRVRRGLGSLHLSFKLAWKFACLRFLSTATRSGSRQ